MKVITLVTALLFVVILFLYPKWHILKNDTKSKNIHHKRLAEIAIQSLPSKDVPVAAILIYNNKIIGEGFNTVNKDSNAAGHAEINAISNAIKHIGIKQFKNLNRESLSLITTYEPCLMCRGALLEYNIQNVKFLKEKPYSFNLCEDARQLLYFWRREKTGRAALQDSLFRLHPDFP